MSASHGTASAPGETVRQQRDRFAAMAFTWAHVLFEVGTDLRVRHAEGLTDVLFGRQKAALTGRPLHEVVAPRDHAVVDDLFGMAARLGRIREERLTLTGPNGEQVPMIMAGYAFDPDAGPLYLALRKAAPEELPAAAGDHRDPETGLLDAEGFARLAAERAKAAGEDAEVTLLSLPRLDAVTQALSEAERSDLTSRLADTVRQYSVGGDTAGQVADGRYGMLHGAGTDLDHVKGELARVIRGVDPTGSAAAVESASVAMDDDGEMDEQAVARGLMVTLNRFGSESDFKLSELSRNVEGLVDQAVSQVEGFKRVVKDSAFTVALQPVVCVRTGQIHHFEGLCRFDTSQPGESPFEYLRFAEETGMIHTFDLAMVRKAIEWLRGRPVNSPHSSIAVNLSGHSVEVAKFAQSLFALLDRNDWTRGKLLFEITESARMSDLDAANAFIQGLRRRGHAVCLDDFGAGAASFQYLSALEVDIVKLDGSAVANARRGAQGRAFLCALTELCRRVGTETIAEKIDDLDGLRFCAECGVDHVQGFLFGKPSPRVGDFVPLPNGHLVPR
ncbi:EAL domain, c-di-GMP-specific phosphodiesterase class I (or its enzymatically inactive variant) [Limimonas halophila]|uniref:EAL domain, c-di-GMP-specific phosphodiesterase class I (Or its enzymatically inactive variant) n=1 Tax=Limimonas halophila TaxID=1082479 RepID=A0A1G7LHS6_9PROT|nr:EAL domain-containing protein [Limimonas halophila]SDF48971.1 EAL domain, c-di-GMP-specific phosphodiesterase class I (or its enzymatically inactive variant) [Limimonas halophila]